ncbi:3263_t:CDS:2 [Entrophospora sp. SA101]|nr:3263_t:CDS:2 [Entrophospora sp. SA101]CAJ0836847.1 3985_t:CDS:2 [Entrophospora sp. SA101]CAJ0887818.1 2558_t:CDS:2 [Entrophospora sp. SA101]
MSICQVTLVSFLLHQKECYLDEDCPLISEGQLCIHGVCAFECLGNSDCPQEGKCDSNLCKWSDELTPTTTKEVESPSSSSSPTTTTTSLNNVENLIMQQQQQEQFNSTTDADSNSVSIGSTNDANPLTIPIILGVIIILFTIGILFLLIYLLKKRKVKNKSKLPKIKRSKLSTSSVAPEMRSTSKNNNNGAVGYSASENLGDKSFSHIQSQTVYGNSASATSMIELQTASHLPVLQEHHFMSQDGYISPQP